MSQYEPRGYVSDAHRIIISELDRLRTPKKRLRTGLMIPCPFPPHVDTHPSLAINLDPQSGRPIGTFYCFGCRQKGMWNKLAGQLGLKKVSQQDSDLSEFHGRRVDENLLRIEEDPMAAMCEEFFIDFPVPWLHDDWRTIPGKILKKIGAYTGLDSKTGEQIAILPVRVNGEMVGGIKALFEKSKDKMVPSYLARPGEWAKDKGLFPYDSVKRWARRSGAIVVTEGPRDALRLISCGVPAVAILGTNNWTDKKRDLLLGMGTERIIVMLDSDRAGSEAQKAIKESINGYAEVRTVNMKRLERAVNNERRLRSQKPLKKVDPANIPRKYIKRLRAHFA